MMHLRDNRDFLPTIADGSVHLIASSPPYHIGKEYEGRAPFSEYLDFQKQVAAECFRVLSPRGSICWQVGNHVEKGEIIPLDAVFYEVFKSLGLKLRNRIIWTFNHGLHCTKRLSGRHETILWFTKSDDYLFDVDPIRVPSKYPNKRHFKGPKKGQLSGNPLGKNPGDVWEIPNVKSNHVEKTDHPCQFPVELIERLVLSMTKPGDTVLDPFAGVGTTLIAAEKHGRVGMGCEVIPAYHGTALARLESLRNGTLKTRPMGKPIHQPT
jgi:adenine-specific DNA-methyltransferase